MHSISSDLLKAIMVSGTISLPYSGYFSPFPDGTCSLSILCEYLALEGDPPRFILDYTCPVLLRYQIQSS